MQCEPLLTIVPARPEDAAELAQVLCKEDRQEISAINNEDAHTIILKSKETSAFCYSGLCEGKLRFMGGVCPAKDVPGAGLPWLLSDGTLRDYPLQFLKRSRDMIEQMHNTFPVLFNLVAAENIAARRWLKWLGFSEVYTEPNINNSGLDFIFFAKNKEAQPCATGSA